MIGRMTVEVALPASATLGEGPTWDARTSTLIWVDILESAVHRWDPAAGTDVVIDTGQHVGAAKPREGGGLVINLRDGVALTERDGADGQRRWLVYWARDGVRGNDAAVDPAGRLWAGTMRYDEGARGGWLARVAADGAATVVVDEVSISNGLGWSPDGTRMYYVDTPTGRVDVFDYDVDGGAATNRRPLCTVDDTGGWPDGLCVDADGCVWVALWDGGEIRRYTPAGALDRRLPVPVARPTACCFGGAGLADLYISTARVGLSDAALAGQPLAGSLLVVPDAGHGLPGTVFAG